MCELVPVVVVSSHQTPISSLVPRGADAYVWYPHCVLVLPIAHDVRWVHWMLDTLNGIPHSGWPLPVHSKLSAMMSINFELECSTLCRIIHSFLVVAVDDVELRLSDEIGWSMVNERRDWMARVG